MMNWDDSVPNQKIQAPERKLLWIVVAGTGGKEDYQDIAILPDTQARDILDQLDLNGYLLENPDGGVFELNEDVYKAIGHKQKLHARPDDVKAAASATAPTNRLTAVPVSRG